MQDNVKKSKLDMLDQTNLATDDEILKMEVLSLILDHEDSFKALEDAE